MRAVIDSNPQYQEVSVYRVDWDFYRDAQFTKELRIPRRSTLVMFNGKGEEVGRLIAQTGKKQIEELFKAAL